VISDDILGDIDNGEDDEEEDEDDFTNIKYLINQSQKNKSPQK
jgi:hypothetical protein